jgi:hypothetical protein
MKFTLWEVKILSSMLGNIRAETISVVEKIMDLRQRLKLPEEAANRLEAQRKKSKKSGKPVNELWLCDDSMTVELTEDEISLLFRQFTSPKIHVPVRQESIDLKNKLETTLNKQSKP